jgi:hypothetical protein
MCFSGSRNEALTQRDVKNEGRSDYVHENKWPTDIMPDILRGFSQGMQKFRDDERKSVGFLAHNAKTGWQFRWNQHVLKRK